jgi:voltage-gated potassium channel
MSLVRRISFVVILAATLLALGTVGYGLLLGADWFESLYMTVLTLTTTGYGEIIPGLDRSVPGRAFSIVMMLFGTGLLLWVISSTTAFLVEGELSTLMRRRKMQKAIDKMRDHVIVCGVGTTGVEVVEELVSIRIPCVVIEERQEQIDAALERLQFACVRGDATSEQMLLAAGIERSRGIVTVLPEDKDNLVVTFMARQLNPNVRIVSRGLRHGMRERLVRAGASAVVFPNQIGGLRLVSELVRPAVVSFLDRMLRPGREEVWRFEEVEIGRESAASGKTLGSMRLTERVGLPILAFSEGGAGEVIYYPPPETVLIPDSRLVVLGQPPQVEKLRRIVRQG